MGVINRAGILIRAGLCGWGGSRGFPGWETSRWEWRIRGDEIPSACLGLRIGVLAWSLPRWSRLWLLALGRDRIRDGRRLELRCRPEERRCSSGAWFEYGERLRVGDRGGRRR